MKNVKILKKLRHKTKSRTLFLLDMHKLSLCKGCLTPSPTLNSRFTFSKSISYDFVSGYSNNRVSQSPFSSSRVLVRTSTFKPSSKLQKPSLLLTRSCFVYRSSYISSASTFKRSFVMRAQFVAKAELLQQKHKMIRPLLHLKRESITIVCKDFKMPVYPDQSNKSVCYSRNRIRKQILPSIKYFMNPQVESSLFKMAELLNNEQFFLHSVLQNRSAR